MGCDHLRGPVRPVHRRITFRRPAGLLGLLALASPAAAFAQAGGPSDVESWESFDRDWMDRWKEMRLARRSTRYHLVAVEDGFALDGRSEDAASALVRRVEPDLAGAREIAWRWRVESAIPANADERTKDGDDYAARVFVIFGSGELDGDTRALCYVWAAHEPVGSTYRSPFVDGVQMIVVRSGNDEAGRWLPERADIAADFRDAFGEDLEPVAAVALMVDSDNTGTAARASVDFVRLLDRTPGETSAVASP